MAILLSFVVFLAQRQHSQQRYLESRLRAEKLRGEFVRFVARTGGYSDDASRVHALQERV